MPETSPQGQTTNPSTVPTEKRSRPPGELGGHTVMPWEQGEGQQAPSHIPAGSDATSTASGGSSKSVPPPASGQGHDGLGQGAGASTAKAADGMTPPASESMGVAPPRPASTRPPEGSAGSPGRPNPNAKPMELEQQHPEGMEAARGIPKGSMQVERDEAPQDAMAGAPPTAHKATPQATRDQPERQIEGGDETKAAPKKPVTPTAAQAKPAPEAVDATAKASTPTAAKPVPTREGAAKPMVPSTGQDAAKAASGAPVHPTNPAMQQASGQADPQEDKLIEALDKRLAEMLARALHETVATAVRETRSPPRPQAPPPEQPVKKP
ncbi:MAG: hypothetical protein LC623_06110 [Halobacteriales archaeon]|nr:hypothetical protein [Halobacteriales archaeon]